MSGDCFRLFLWLSVRAWRYPNSPGVVRAAVSFIEEQTGMGHATVSRALKALKESGLVDLVETDFKLGNVWKVSNLAFSGKSPDPGPAGRGSKTEAPRNEVPRRESEGASKRGSISLKTSAEPPRNEEHLKNYENSKELSQEALASLNQRIDAMTAPRKRETEMRHLNVLLDAYAPSDLLRAVTYLETKGTLRGEKCHSPFSYLSLAADEIMKRISRATPESPMAATAADAAPEEVSEELRATAVSRFEAELSPELQRQVTDEFTAKAFPHGFFPPTRVLRSLVAVAWLSRSGLYNEPKLLQAV
jgi:hypothetical protein